MWLASSPSQGQCFEPPSIPIRQQLRGCLDCKEAPESRQNSGKKRQLNKTVLRYSHYCYSYYYCY